ncbi:tripartite motif-containing protein 7 [Sinocyclocheilus rhinocerous]|uniref:tripartite motif-containing protein 7 n=1 Tax=Sinocyclocheilus rhinocerous TaxID=307959 RepID=UPI0007B79262|nr:PREDICTED: tripartite motif-containing protein 7-like [Sinocyclocheilus rhinocerous]
MAFAAAEDKSTGITLSDISLHEPHIKKNARASASFPVIKPNLSAQPSQYAVKIIHQLGKVFYQWFKIPAINSTEQKGDLALEESVYNIRELAAELDRVVQSKKLSLMTRKIKNKGSNEEQEEQQYYILQWAKDLENIKTKQMDKKETSSEQLSSEMKINKAKKILSDWFWRLKDLKQNSVCPKGGWEETLRDLHKEWKQGESSMLPVMDWMVWAVLQSECSEEDSVPRLWVRSKQRSKITVGLRIPNTVWNWITKSTADVILDPNTANPDLLVSEDGKYLKAKKYGHESWKGFQWKRSKFDGWTCVQAEEGYNAGRHYWEVDVRKKHEWRVGVVKESAPRNGYVTMNTKTGYWNLRLQLGTLMALTEPVTKVNLPTPSRVGVYLDIEEGHVSFYDAVKRIHIFSFNTDFNETENIYPVFGTVETDRALMISS